MPGTLLDVPCVSRHNSQRFSFIPKRVMSVMMGSVIG